MPTIWARRGACLVEKQNEHKSCHSPDREIGGCKRKDHIVARNFDGIPRHSALVGARRPLDDMMAMEQTGSLHFSQCPCPPGMPSTTGWWYATPQTCRQGPPIPDVRFAKPETRVERRRCSQNHRCHLPADLLHQQPDPTTPPLLSSYRKSGFGVLAQSTPQDPPSRYEVASLVCSGGPCLHV